MTDEPLDDVQPEDEGQGEVETTDAPYSEYLNRIPEGMRGVVEPVFKEWDAGVTKRFQSHAEKSKVWEPYEQAGVNQHDPQAVQAALQFYEAVQTNPAGVWEWAQQYAQQYGLTPQQAQQAAQQQQADPTQDEFQYVDPSQQMQQLLEQRLTPMQQQLQQTMQYLQQQDHQQRVHNATQFLESQLKALEEKHGDSFDRELVERFAANYIDTPDKAIEMAWRDAQAYRNKIEQTVLQSKVDAPGPAESGGLPDVAPNQVHSFKDAEEIVRRTLQNNRSA